MLIIKLNKYKFYYFDEKAHRGVYIENKEKKKRTHIFLNLYKTWFKKKKKKKHEKKHTQKNKSTKL